MFGLKTFCPLLVLAYLGYAKQHLTRFYCCKVTTSWARLHPDFAHSKNLVVSTVGMLNTAARSILLLVTSKWCKLHKTNVCSLCQMSDCIHWHNFYRPMQACIGGIAVVWCLSVCLSVGLSGWWIV